MEYEFICFSGPGRGQDRDAGADQGRPRDQERPGQLAAQHCRKSKNYYTMKSQGGRIKN